MKMSSMISQGNQQENFKLTIRYKKGSDLDIILQHLRGEKVNISELMRELLIAAKGVEVLSNYSNVSRKQLENNGKKSIVYLTSLIEIIRVSLGLKFREIGVTESKLDNDQFLKNQEIANQEIANQEIANQEIAKKPKHLDFLAQMLPK